MLSKKNLVLILLLTLLFWAENGSAQWSSYKIYKKDTINRVDKKGLKQGTWMKFYDSGKVLSSGTFKNNNKQGTFKYFYESGKLKGTAEFNESGSQCLFSGYHENGKPEAIGNYWNEKKDSVWRYFNQDSVLISIENYKKGIADGVWRTFYGSTKKMVQMITYKNGKKTGPMKEYFEDGHVKFDCILVDGSIEGPTKFNYVDGTTHYEGAYIHGLKDGIWKTYDEYGKPQKTEVYKLGELIEDKTKTAKDSALQKK